MAAKFAPSIARARPLVPAPVPQLGDISPEDQQQVNAWIQATEADHTRVVTRMPSGTWQGALASRLILPDPTLADKWDYETAPISILLLDLRGAGGPLDFSGNLARNLMDYSGAVTDTIKLVADTAADAVKAGAGFTLGLIPWWLWALAGVGVVVALKNPERTRQYVRRFRTNPRRRRR